jgi:hypothetical protein
VVISVGLHGGLLVLFAMMARQAPKQAAKVVDGVDLLVAAPKQKLEAPPKVKAPKLSTMDFLKLALPTAPRHVAPAQLNIKIPSVVVVFPASI